MLELKNAQKLAKMDKKPVSGVRPGKPFMEEILSGERYIPHIMLDQVDYDNTSETVIYAVNLENGKIDMLTSSKPVIHATDTLLRFPWVDKDEEEQKEDEKTQDIPKTQYPDSNMVPFETFREYYAQIQGYVSEIDGYDPETIYIEKQSFHPDDWYLYTVVARRLGKPDEYAVWTANLSIGELNHGYYDVKQNSILEILAKKRR